MKVKYIFTACILSLILLVAACSSLNTSRVPPLQNGRWMIVPFINNSNTPRAGYAAANITFGVLRSQGYYVTMYNIPTSSKAILPQEVEANTVAKAIYIACQHGFRYVVTGSVNEWRYKAGLDGEPAVSVSIQLVDAYTHQVIWSTVTSGSGWGRDSVTNIAQRQIQNALNVLPAGRR